MNAPVRIEEFLSLSEKFPIADVRSPAEFEQGHIPKAYNIPLFNNEERARIGTIYKQIGREEAIKIGCEIANPKINSFLAQVQSVCSTSQTLNSQSRTVLIHCWRGGMRSAKFAALLNKHGYKTYTLVRGYKAYRNFVLQSFNNTAEMLILGGETGSGKTEILQRMAQLGERVIDLEGLANHKGSAFGSLGEKPQPTQEQFENNLSFELTSWPGFQIPTSTPQVASPPLSFGEGAEVRLWLEDESRTIGTCQIPNPIWEKMKQAPIFCVKMPKQERIRRLLVDYGNFSKEELAKCIRKIEKRLGPQHAKQGLEELENGNLHAVADIALTYYDKAYCYNHEKRNFKNLCYVECDTADAYINADKIMKAAKNLQIEVV